MVGLCFESGMWQQCAKLGYYAWPSPSTLTLCWAVSTHKLANHILQNHVCCIDRQKDLDVATTTGPTVRKTLLPRRNTVGKIKLVILYLLPHPPPKVLMLFGKEDKQTCWLCGLHLIKLITTFFITTLTHRLLYPSIFLVTSCLGRTRGRLW
jgi:hypothetical protein